MATPLARLRQTRWRMRLQGKTRLPPTSKPSPTASLDVYIEKLEHFGLYILSAQRKAARGGSSFGRSVMLQLAQHLNCLLFPNDLVRLATLWSISLFRRLKRETFSPLDDLDCLSETFVKSCLGQCRCYVRGDPTLRDNRDFCAILTGRFYPSTHNGSR